jgi:PEP-CTERM motif
MRAIYQGWCVLRLIKLFLVAVATLIVSSVPASASPILQVNASGILTGALNVDVGGTLYDVAFVDTSCVAAYSGCDGPSDFPFTTAAAAQAASQALLDQVFVNGPAGNFDATPALIFGCTSSPLNCSAWTPYGLGGQATALSKLAVNVPGVNPDSVADAAVANSASFVQFVDSTLAQWTPSTTAVPEPTSMLLFSAGLAGLAARRYRRGR